MCDCMYQEAQEGVESPKAGITHSCALSAVGAGNRTCLLEAQSKLLIEIHLSNLTES